MRKTVFFVLFVGFMFSPLSVFSAGGKDVCELNIENKTGTQVTQIIVEEIESKDKPQSIVKNLTNDTSIAVKVKRNVLYNITLINTDGRQYAKKRQVWDEETADLVFVRRDLQNQSFWEKAREAIEDSVPVLKETGKVIAESVEEGYKKMKEEDSLRKAAEVLGKLTEAGLKAGVDFTIGAGKILVRVSDYTMERIEQEKKLKLNSAEREILDEYVEFTVENSENTEKTE